MSNTWVLHWSSNDLSSIFAASSSPRISHYPLPCITAWLNKDPWSPISAMADGAGFPVEKKHAASMLQHIHEWLSSTSSRWLDSSLVAAIEA